jgi:WD40 repeat protein
MAGVAMLVASLEMMAEKGASAPKAQIWSTEVEGVGAVESVRFSPDGATLASLDSNGHAILCDTATGRRTGTRLGHLEGIRSLAFSPDRRTLATGGDDATIRLWDLESAEVRSELRADTGSVRALAFSPDGRELRRVRTAP